MCDTVQHAVNDDVCDLAENMDVMIFHDKPLISVIIPVYRVESTLDRCVRSVANQTYRNLEIILIDDGSPDGCPDLCDAWARRDGRIRVIHQRNQGLSAARNTGLSHMHGEYVAFVDSDDYVEPGFIELLLAALQRNKVDLAVSAILRETADGTILTHHYGAPARSTVDVWDAHRCMTMRDGQGTSLIVAWNKLYVSRLWQSVRFPVGKLHEDEFVFHRIIAQCARVVLLPEELYHYVDTPKSIMNTGFSIRNLDRLEAKVDRVRFYTSMGYGPDVMATAVDTLIWELQYACGHVDTGDRAMLQRFMMLAHGAWKAVRSMSISMELQRELKIMLYGAAPLLMVRITDLVHSIRHALQGRS